MNKGNPTLLLLLLAILAVYGLAQQPAASPTPAAERGDDILILVNLTADELKFDVVREAKVEFPGTKDRSTVWITDRQNLPETLEPGVTYRNIGIQLRISSRFRDIEQIVREALGEAPLTAPPVSESKPPAPVRNSGSTQTKP